MEQIVEFMTQSPTNIVFGTTLVLVAFCIGIWIHNKTRLECLSPVLIGMALVIIFLLVVNVGEERIGYDQFRESTVLFRFLLAPATVALAIPLYENVNILRKNLGAILIAVTAGVLISGFSVLLISWGLGMNEEAFRSVYPKSITTAMGLALSEVWAGREGVTTAAIFITGMFGNIMARP
ncbi:MAG: LrgB family protein, partial [Oscillospiraceae bacterium]|nr:LrgB family protein [Oscillospiraceae bacterium]